MKTITLKELAIEAVKLTKAGLGNQKILLANDDECNGVHALTTLFSRLTSEDDYIWLPYGITLEEVVKDYLVLG